MTDVNEQSFSAGTKAEIATSAGRVSRSRAAPPIWPLRQTLKSANVVRTLKTQIIPKIVMALRSPAVQVPAETAPSDEVNNVQRLASLALGNADDAALLYVQAMIEQDASIETIFIDVLAPAARHLGALWESDAADFAKVTLAMSRLQRILRILAEKSFDSSGYGDCGDAVLLTAIPGEQHSFGLSMVAEFFRRDGWNLCTGPFASHLELTSLVHNHWFDVIGFSVSSERGLHELRQDIGDIRRDSRNKNVGIMLGGPITHNFPKLVESVGADLISADATTAPQQARFLVERMQKSG